MAQVYEGFSAALGHGVLTITFDRPETGNAIASAAVPQLQSLFEDAAARVDVRVVLIRATGRSFCAGGDVKGFAATLERAPEIRRAEFHERLDRARGHVEAFLALPCPVIVACQGGVAGAGIAYPLGADIVLAEPGTKFVFAHQRVGLPPDVGLSYMLPRVLGLRKSLELVLTAATLDAAEALRIGLVSRVVPLEQLEHDANDLALRLAKAPQVALRRAKKLLMDSLSKPLEEQLVAERDAIAASVMEHDFEEGVRAFLEKRSPVFGVA